MHTSGVSTSSKLPTVSLLVSEAIRVRADISDERHINEAFIANDVLLTGPEPALIWHPGANPALIAESVHYQGLLDRLNPATFNVENLTSSSQYLSGDFAVLAGVWSTNFYHWFEELFRANILEQSGFKGRYIVHQSDAFVEESLEMMGISRDRVVVYTGSNLLIERAWFTGSVPMYSWSELPNMFYQFRSKFLPQGPSGQLRRIFVLRGRHARNFRDIVNRDEVINIAREFDYEIMDFALLPFREQVGVANSSQSIMGMHGAAFCHTMFMPRKGNVIEFFSPNYVNYTTISLATLLRHKYMPIIAQKNVEYAHGEDAIIDMRLLRIALENNQS